jgi:hypothetical protein
MARVTNTEVTVWADRADTPAVISVREYSEGIIVDVCNVDIWLTVEQAKDLSEKLDSVIATKDEIRLASLKDAHDEYERLAQN